MLDATTMRLDWPGSAFHESLLLGNGEMGAALYGDPAAERVQLTHVAFVSGEPDTDALSPDAPAHFRAAREAALRGDYARADEEIRRFHGHKENYGTALPVGALCISQPLGGIADYARELDLSAGVARVRFLHAGGEQTRECFCSHVHKAFVLRVSDTAPTTARVSLTTFAPGAITTSDAALRFETQALETVHSDGKCGARLAGVVALQAQDGRVFADKDALVVENCREWTLTVRMNTDYTLCEDRQVPLAFPEPLDGLSAYAALRSAHIADFSALMNRADVRVSGDDTAGAANRLFALGRYLTVSAGRHDSVLPMNLQGVWNDGVACRIGWTCDEHLDINTQMNYWLCEQTGLSESHLPLFRWMEKRLIPHGARAAARHYGLPGWVGELTANPWGYAQPYWDWSLAPCPACGAWQALDYMTHVRKTGDAAFLREHALPVLRESARFFLAYLFPDEKGALQSGPSISPENAFLPPNDRRRFSSLSPTFEVCVIRALLADFIEACELAGETEDALLSEARSALGRLPDMPILPDGSLGEWRHGLPAQDPQHRHTSHLCGLYPLRQISPEATPRLAEAARRSIEGRTTPYERWEDTGWARSLLLLYAARLWDGEAAVWHLREAVDRLTLPNGLVMHPVTRATGTDAPVWELDGNTGIAAGIAEMLLQSDAGAIHVLPALPGAWTKGAYRGLMADGVVQVSAAWDERQTRVTLVSPAAQTVSLRARKGAPVSCALQPDTPFHFIFKEEELP